MKTIVLLIVIPLLSLQFTNAGVQPEKEIDTYVNITTDDTTTSRNEQQSKPNVNLSNEKSKTQLANGSIIERHVSSNETHIQDGLSRTIINTTTVIAKMNASPATKNATIHPNQSTSTMSLNDEGETVYSPNEKEIDAEPLVTNETFTRANNGIIETKTSTKVIKIPNGGNKTITVTRTVIVQKNATSVGDGKTNDTIGLHNGTGTSPGSNTEKMADARTPKTTQLIDASGTITETKTEVKKSVTNGPSTTGTLNKTIIEISTSISEADATNVADGPTNDGASSHDENKSITSSNMGEVTDVKIIKPPELNDESETITETKAEMEQPITNEAPATTFSNRPKRGSNTPISELPNTTPLNETIIEISTLVSEVDPTNVTDTTPNDRTRYHNATKTTTSSNTETLAEIMTIKPLQFYDAFHIMPLATKTPPNIGKSVSNGPSTTATLNKTIIETSTSISEADATNVADGPTNDGASSHDENKSITSSNMGEVTDVKIIKPPELNDESETITETKAEMEQSITNEAPPTTFSNRPKRGSKTSISEPPNPTTLNETIIEIITSISEADPTNVTDKTPNDRTRYHNATKTTTSSNTEKLAEITTIKPLQFNDAFHLMPTNKKTMSISEKPSAFEAGMTVKEWVYTQPETPNVAVNGSPASRANSKCIHMQYYHEEQGRCLKVPGGGSFKSIDDKKPCFKEMFKADPSNERNYITCQMAKMINAECAKNQVFSENMKRCTFNSPL